jgi:hypothetical protein
MNKLKNQHGGKEISAAIIGGIFAILATLLGYYLYQMPDNSINKTPGGLTSEQLGKIKSAVVYIECPTKENEFVFSADMTSEAGPEASSANLSSGVLINSNGRILTSSHVFAENEMHNDGCFVQLFDPQFGRKSEIYIGEPIVIPELSEYNLAFLDIYDVYIDPDNNTHGYLPRDFTFYDIAEYECNKEMEVDSSVKVLGYPNSNNNELTTEEGKISSFEESYYLTNARIDAGNSGGLSFDEDGCFTGISNALPKGDGTTLKTIIYPADVKEFLERASAVRGKYSPRRK